MGQTVFYLIRLDPQGESEAIRPIVLNFLYISLSFQFFKTHQSLHH